mgnify:CR=1 FL=1
MIGFYNYTVLLTYVSAVAAAVGIVFAMHGNGFAAILCLMASGICDMFDGLVAKTRERTRQEKRFGIWIDSLADVVAFGVLPAVIGYSFGMKQFYYIFVIAVYVLAAVIRLAYYGVTEEERQNETTAARTSYIGLPVTSAALIFPLLYCFKGLIGSTYFAPVYSLVMAVTALAFVMRFKVKKLMCKGMLALLGIGVVIFLTLLFLRTR